MERSNTSKALDALTPSQARDDAIIAKQVYGKNRKRRTDRSRARSTTLYSFAPFWAAVLLLAAGGYWMSAHFKSERNQIAEERSDLKVLAEAHHRALEASIERVSYLAANGELEQAVHPMLLMAEFVREGGDISELSEEFAAAVEALATSDEGTEE